MSSTNIIAAAGHHSFWGLSASFDIVQAHHVAFGQEHSNEQPFRILLIEPGDIRHILSIIAHRRRDEMLKVPIEIYLLENTTEILARELLLLELLCDFEVPIRQRATIFLEVFGNLKVQDRTSRYIEHLGNNLRQFLVSGKGQLENLVSFDAIRYREKDELESSFKNFSRSLAYNVDNYRDHRLRGLFAERYDNRTALADWDYHENLRSRASIIHIKQFKEWRKSGIAMEFGDQMYTEPNRTFISYTEGVLKAGKDKGFKKEVMGYWGDVVSSPYFSFGVDCETPNKFAERLFDIYNKNTGAEQHRHHAVEVCMYSLLSQLWELETGQVYTMARDHDVYSGLGKEGLPQSDSQGDEDDDHEGAVEDMGAQEEQPGQGEKADKANESESAPKNNQESLLSEEDELAQAIRRAECIVETLRGVKVLPVKGPANTVLSKSKYEGLFDAVFASCRSAQVIKEGYLQTSLKPRALVACETAKFFVPLPRQDQKEQFVAKLGEFATEAGLASIAAPVARRHRDERDTEDDVVFFVKR